MITVANAHHPSALEWHTARLELQRQEDHQQSQIKVADGGDEKGNSRLHKLKGQLSVDTALTAQGGSRAPSRSAGYTPSREVQESSANVRSLLSKFGSFLSKIDDELEEASPKDVPAAQPEEVEQAEVAAEEANKVQTIDGVDNQANGPGDDPVHAGVRAGWSLAQLLTSVEGQISGFPTEAELSLLKALRKGKNSYDECLLTFLQNVLTQTGASDGTRRHLLKVGPLATRCCSV